VYKKVIWATDGSGSADLALDHAKSLVSEAGGQLLIVHCEEYMPGRAASFPVNASPDEVKAKIEGQAAALRAEGVEATVRLIEASAGGAAHAIAEAAADEGADVIVVGTRGHTALAGLLLGSVTQRLLHVASCPVLAVPAGRH
jgi:nucleotide-binding universal stress UspA family protein